MPRSHTLSHIGRIVEAKEREIERLNHEKYGPVFKVAMRFLSKQHVLLYGGTAIHEIVGGIYGPHELVDLDVMALDAEGVAHALAKHFQQYDRTALASAAPALHPGTWKVYVNGLSVADITDVPKDVFERYYENGRATSLGLRTVNVEFLRMSLHAILSQPFDAHRWEKAYDRFRRFFRHLPIRAAALKRQAPSAPAADARRPHWPAGDAALATVKGMAVGAAAVAEAVARRPAEARRWKAAGIDREIVIVQDNAAAVAKKFLKLAGAPGPVSLGPVTAPAEHFGARVEVRVGGVPWVTFVEIPTCVSYRAPSLKPSIHTLIRIYYALSLSDNDAGALWTAHVLERTAFLSQKPQLETLCFGIAKGKATLRRERYERLLERSAA